MTTANDDNTQEASSAHRHITPSASWYAESQFWWTKCQRARIRLEKAQERGDEKAAEIAKKQFDLYKRRFDAAIPKEVQDEWAAEDAAETKAAMEE